MGFRSKEIVDVFSEIYKKYYKLVYFVAFSYLRNPDDAEDVTQDVFWHFFEKAGSCEGWLSKLSNIKSYLCECAKNSAIKIIDKRNRLEFTNDIDKFGKCSENAEEEIDLSRIFKLLDEQSIDIINDHVFIGLSFREISLRDGLPINTLKSKYRRALGKIRKEFKNDKKIF